MAEGFANKYGGDVLLARSAGLSPVPAIVAETVAIMDELNVDVSKHVPMLYDPFRVEQYDIVVNMSGFRLPGKAPKELLEWDVKDPYMNSAEIYRKVRGDIEERVMQLILRLRREQVRQMKD